MAKPSNASCRALCVGAGLFLCAAIWGLAGCNRADDPNHLASITAASQTAARPTVAAAGQPAPADLSASPNSTGNGGTPAASNSTRNVVAEANPPGDAQTTGSGASKNPAADPPASPDKNARQPNGPEPAAGNQAQPNPAQPTPPPQNTAPKPPENAAPMPEHPFPNARRAPSLDGGLEWINTAGPLDLQDLKGKFVLLDFWTYCCINCMHILPELKKLEKAYPNEVVVIGVHSAKFLTEEDSKNIREAVLRYEIEHPVVNDANHAIWDRFHISSWPSLRVIDPEGNLVAGDSGEVQFEVLDQFLKTVLPYYKQKGLLDETPLRFDLEEYSADRTPLRFPGKVLADAAGGRLFIADSNHNRIVITDLAGKLQQLIGSGQIGTADGGFAQAQFNKPQGMALQGQTLYVADTENHMLRKVDLEKKQVTTLSGNGKQGRIAWPGLLLDPDQPNVALKVPRRFVGVPKQTELNSPWDLWIQGDGLYIAMAGPHQIWKMTLDEKEIGPYAGNGREDIVDGPLVPERPYELGYASFAQPSGLSSDGQVLYVADSEGSSIRSVPFDEKQEVATLLGTANLASARLFTFGDKDGDLDNALLQHCLGVAFHEGLLYVADTYNNKIKVVDLKKKSIRTLAGTGEAGRSDQPALFDEPAGLTVAAGKLYVADTNNHLIRTVDLKTGQVGTLTIQGLTPPPKPEVPLATGFKGKQIDVPSTPVKVAEQSIRLAVSLELPAGYKINDQAPMGYRVEAVAESGPVARAALGKTVRLKEPAARFEVALPVSVAEGADKLRVTLTYYYCQEAAQGLCKMGQVRWTVPLELSASGVPAAPLQYVVE